MNLEECKRIADDKLDRIRKIRRSMGRVEGEELEVLLSTNPSDSHRKNCLVLVFAYGEVSIKEFKWKDFAESHFDELTQKYGLKEEK